MFSINSLDIKINEGSAARRTVPFSLINITNDDRITGANLPSVSATVYKNGVSAGASTGTALAGGNGEYYFQLAAGDVNTLGLISVHFTYSYLGVTAHAWVTHAQVVQTDPYINLDAEFNSITVKTDQLTYTGGSVNAYPAAVGGLSSSFSAIQTIVNKLQFDTNLFVKSNIQDPGVIGSTIALISPIKSQTDKMLFTTGAPYYIRSSAGAKGVLPDLPDMQAGLPTVPQIITGVWEEDLTGHTGLGNNAANWVSKPVLSMKPTLQTAICIDAIDKSSVLTMGFEIFDQSGKFVIETSKIAIPGGFSIIRFRAGVPTVLFIGGPDIIETGHGVLIGKDRDLMDFKSGDVLILILEYCNVADPDLDWSIVFPRQIAYTSMIGRDDIIQADIKRSLGLTHENIYVVNTYDEFQRHVGSEIEIYDSKVNAELHDGVTGFVESYTLTITYNEDDKVETHTMVRNGPGD